MSKSARTRRQSSFVLTTALITTSLVTLMAPAGAALAQDATAQTGAQLEEIIVTAQRQAQSLQEVPIAVSAFGAEELEKSGTQGVADLQFQLPNVTFTKTNFTSASFQIRGIGANAVGATTDESTGIHVNDVPIGGARIFETEFFDVERVEVLRGPQGTQFGRSSTGGTVNMITARPTFDMASSIDAEVSNYKGLKLKGMMNVPLSDTLAVRFAGIYLTRDGYTENLHTGNNIDGRDQYSVRGSLRWQPTTSTTVDFMASTFREDSDRARIQKQQCNRDPTGVYGCLPNSREYETTNANSTLASILTSTQFLQIAGFGSNASLFALNNLAGPDAYSGVVNPDDNRTVDTDYEPTYKSREDIFQLALRHDFDSFNVKINAGYTDNGVDSTSDYNLAVSNDITVPTAVQLGLTGELGTALFRDGQICVSAIDEGKTGYIGGNILQCADNTTEYDRSYSRTKQYAIEGIVSSTLDGPLNGSLGVSYGHSENETDYYVVSSGLDYAAGLLGLSTGQALASPYFDSDSQYYRLETMAVFGEARYDMTDAVGVIAGLRYTKDKKFVRARQTLLNVAIDYGTTDATEALDTAEPYSEDSATFDAVTGRLVANWKPSLTFTDETLIYASFSKGYKGGGINPPFDQALFPSQTKTYKPETIWAYEVGTKNRFGGGRLQANLTGFYYDYKDMQISSIVSRTSFNANIDAKIWGVEGEFQALLTDNLTMMLNASYMRTRIADGVSVLDPSNPAAGRTDVLVIKDLTNGSLCVAVPNQPGGDVRAALRSTGTALGSNGTLAVNAANTAQPVPEIGGYSAYSVCSALSSIQQGFEGVAGAGAAGYTITDGIGTDLSGNELQNSPRYKLSAALDYTYPLENGMAINGRLDYTLQGKSWGRIYNLGSDRIDGYDLINLRLTLRGPNDRWNVSAFVENLENDAAVTGLYVTDQSSGLFRNIFTTEPRRFGLAAGMKF